MQLLEKIFAQLCEFLTVKWQNFAVAVERDKKRTLRRCFVGLVCSLIFAGFILTSQPKIRQAQYENLVFAHEHSKKMLPINYDELATLLSEKKAVSVMFSTPNGVGYNTVKDILASEQAEELNRTFYYYPVVYDVNELQTRYQIDPDKVTFVFFEDGTEKNRFTLDELADVNADFIPELNRLPMWNIGK